LDAIFFGFNIQAVGGLKYLADNNISYPEDISISIIGSPEWVNIGKNNIEHIDQNSASLGREAAQLMMDIISNKQTEIVNKINSCVLVKGSSVKKNN